MTVAEKLGTAPFGMVYTDRHGKRWQCVRRNQKAVTGGRVVKRRWVCLDIPLIQYRSATWLTRHGYFGDPEPTVLT